MVNIRKNIGFADIIRRSILAWLIAANFEYLILPSGLKYLGSLEGLAQMSFVRLIVITALVFVVLSAAACFRDTRCMERWTAAAACAVLAAFSVKSSYFFFFLGICGLVVLLFGVYSFFGWDERNDVKSSPEKAKPIYYILTAIITLVFTCVISVWSVQRIFCFQAQTYDMGIFTQMFYYMKTTGMQLTTLERDGLLSHFAVHISPIFYLMLPFYIIAPYAETLEVLQVVVLASSVIPLWKICRLHGMKDLHTTIFCVMLLVYPALFGGTSIGLHENCFLTPLILWLLYSVDKGSLSGISISAFLTLMVKEDAAVYVAIIAVWLILKAALRKEKSRKKEIITGAVMLIAALLWFALATSYLANSGTGVMTDRYENFFYEEDSSLITVVKACLLQPMRLIYECVGEGKRVYIIYTLLPLLGLPILTRKYERLLLLIPYILINLMSDYSYQHDVMLQYNFGSLACMFYLSAVNFADIKWQKVKLPALALALACGFLCFMPNSGKHIRIFNESYEVNYDWFTSTRESLDTIPEDASVAAVSSLTVDLADRDTVYDVYYTSEENLLSTDYVVLNTWDALFESKFSTETQTGYENLGNFLLERGYMVVRNSEDGIIIYQKP